MTGREGRAHYRKMTRRDLTARQREVLALIAQGLTKAEIGERLGITLDGAKYHVAEILERLGVGSREEAAEWWREEDSMASRLRGAGTMVAGAVTWKWAAGVGVAVVGAGAAVAVLVATAGDEATPMAPAAATATPTATPEATPTQGPGIYGRFEIVPEGSPLEVCAFRDGAEVWRPYSWAERSSISRVGLRYSQLDERYPLYVRAPTLPPGWDLIEFRSDMTLFTTGALETTAFGLTFEDQDGGSIVILRMLREPGCTVQVSGPFGTGTIGGVEAVFHMEEPWSVHWFNGDVLTMVWSNVWDVDALMPVAVEVFESLE